MATTQATDIQSVGTVDESHTTKRALLADLITEDLRLTDWAVFWTVAVASIG
jgi:hypothetical protein